MSYTMEDYLRETREEIIGSLTGTDIDRILKNLGPEDIFGMFAPEDRLRGLGAEDRLKGLTTEEIEEYLRKIKRKEQ